jgi:hypothetical protein
LLLGLGLAATVPFVTGQEAPPPIGPEKKRSRAGSLSSSEEFDRTLARVWAGVSDLQVAGAYVQGILNRSWGFHDQTLASALHTAHAYLQQQIERLKKMSPGDPERRRIAQEVLQTAASADRYVELMTGAITEAQRSNSWMGKPNDMYAQARALEPMIVFPSQGLDTLRKSRVFRDALPPDRRAGLGLANDPRDFDLGAECYTSTPDAFAVVRKGGLADAMGFKAGDRLVSVQDQPLKSLWELKLAMRANAGKSITVVFERRGKQQQRTTKVPGHL